MSPPYKGIQDSLGVWIPRCGFRILDTGFQIFNCGIWIPDSNCLWDPGFLECILDSEAEDLDTTGEHFPDFGIPWAKIYPRIRIPLLLFRTQVPFIYHHPQLIIGLPVAQSKNELRLCRNLTKWCCVSYSPHKGGINLWGGGGCLLFDHEISIDWKLKQVFFIVYTRFRRSYKLSIE